MIVDIIFSRFLFFFYINRAFCCRQCVPFALTASRIWYSFAAMALAKCAAIKLMAVRFVAKLWRSVFCYFKRVCCTTPTTTTTTYYYYYYYKHIYHIYLLFEIPHYPLYSKRLLYYFYNLCTFHYQLLYYICECCVLYISNFLYLPPNMQVLYTTNRLYLKLI